jgi:phosphatidylinositol 3-kinase
MIEKLKSALSKGSASAYYSLCTITAQCKFVETLVKISNQTTESGGGRDKKLTFLKNKLSESSVLNNLKELLFPLDPTVKLKSVQPESTQIFASKLMPMRLTFLTTSKRKDSLLNYNDSYMVIFKRGDDLR